MHPTPLLGRPAPWRFGELASLKIAMICLGIIIALGTPPLFWQEYYWLVWLVFVIAMVAPASKWLHVINGRVPAAPKPKRKRA